MLFRTQNVARTVLSFLLCCFLWAAVGQSLQAQTNISGTINQYAKVTAIGSTGCEQVLTVSATAPFAVGDKVLVIQMKGASIVSTAGSAYGSITALNDAGNYEFAFVSAVGAGTITLTSLLQRTYDPAGLVQVATVPQYTNATVTGTLTCPAWNAVTGTGGILVFDVANVLTLNANIDVSGRGFRGGDTSRKKDQFNALFCSNMNWFYPNVTGQNGNGGEKGEGIADWVFNQERGKGALANGGGGGNIQNAGGGGGSNAGAAGKGGNSQTGGGCGMANTGGLGGYDLTAGYALSKIFLGGGGGGGQMNNSEGTKGGAGGGLVIISAGTVANGGAFKIMSNGVGVNIFSPTTGGDGAGGGGAGGTVLLNVSTYTNAVTVEANGGKGGNVNAWDTGRCMGAGGGGGGGAVWFSTAATPANVTVSVTGGARGVNQITNACGADPGNGSLAGQNGLSFFNLQFPAPAASYTFTTTSTNPSCNGGANGTITVTPNPLPSANYEYFLDGVSNGNNNVFSGLGAATYIIKVKDASGCEKTASVTLTNPATLGGSYTVLTQPACSAANGSLSVSATGGAGGYTYSINGGAFGGSATFSGLSGGSGTITIKDANGCTFDLPYTLTQPNAPTASIASTTPVSCHNGTDGQIVVTASGGTGTLSYYLNNVLQSGSTFSNLSAGTYTIDVKDQGNCVATLTATLANPPLLTLSATGANPACGGVNNGTIVATGSGGTGTLNYQLNGGAAQPSGSFSGLGAGVYTIRVFDAKNCEATQTVTLSNPPPLALSIVNVTDSPCVGGSTGSATLTTSGGVAPYTYVLNGGTTNQTGVFTGLAQGNYTVVVTDNVGCTDSKSFTIVQPANSLTLIITNQTNVTCQGAANGSITAQANGGSGSGYSYQLNGGTAQTSGSFAGLGGGAYSLKVTDGNGCTATASVTLNEPSALTGSMQTKPLSCGGANDGSLTFSVSGGAGGYSYVWTPSGSGATLTGLGAGTYSVVATDANGCTVSGSATLFALPAINVSLTATDILCNGQTNGKITAAVSGGTPGYSFTWTGPNGFSSVQQNLTNLAAGDYSVTVKDQNNCTQTAIVTINQPAALSVSAIINDVNCTSPVSGGSDITVSGGTMPYTYLWNNGSANEDLTNAGAGNYFVQVTDANGCKVSYAVEIDDKSVLNVSVAKTNALCNGSADGTASITVSGGIAPYAYAWTGGLSGQQPTGIAAGTYTVTVSDAFNCTGTAVVNIGQPAALSISAVVDSVSCNGLNDGKIALTVSGGSPQYSYSWGGGQSSATLANLAPGVYSVTVTDGNNCTTTASYTVSEPVAFTATAASTDVLCAGTATGAIDLTVSGGVAPFLYVWSNGENTEDISGLVDGTYTVIVADKNGCTVTASATLNEPPIFSVSVVSTHATCFGANNGTATATAGGGTGNYTYSWSSGQNTAAITGLAPGVYVVTAQDGNNCTATATVTVLQPNALTVSVLSQTNNPCNGDTKGSININATGGTPPYAYQWSNGLTTKNLQNLAAGTYTVEVADANGCTATATANVTEPQAISTTNIVKNLTCFGAANGEIDLTVTGGTPPYAYQWSSGQITQDLANIAGGSYTCKITDANGCVFTTSPIVVVEPAKVTVTAAKTNITCKGANDGTITLTIAGGTPPYTVIWTNGANSPSLTGLAPGIYIYNVTDANGCPTAAPVSGTVTLTEPDALQLAFTNQNPNCAGATNGSIFVQIGGGTPPYSLTKDGLPVSAGMISGLAAGAHFFAVKDAQNCEFTQTVTLTAPQALTILSTQKDVQCAGGQDGEISITASGGTPPYDYFWSDGVQDISTRNNLSAGAYTVYIRDAVFCLDSVVILVGQPQPLSASIAIINTGCHLGANAKVDLTVAGGTAPYSYLWSNGQTIQDAVSLPAGVADVVVTDANQCTVSAMVNIVTPPAISTTFAVQNVTCAGGPASGKITLQATGGQPPFVYWINAAAPQATGVFAGLSAGNYTVTVQDANECIFLTDVVVANQSPFVGFSLDAHNVTCNGANDGYATVLITGGTQPYSYSIDDLTFGVSPLFPNLAPGNYKIYAKDATGCLDSIPFVITEPQALVLAAAATPVQCVGQANGEITTAVSGGTPPYRYSLNNQPFAVQASFSNLPLGTYIVTVRDTNNCTATDTVEITQPEPIAFSLTKTNALCFGQATGEVAVTATGGTPPLRYSINGGAYQTNPLFTNLPAGTYTVEVTDANFCLSVTKSIVVEQPLPLELVTKKTNITCPGFKNGTIGVGAKGGTAPYVYTVNGAVVSADSGAKNLNVGSYNVLVTDANGCTANASVQIVEDNVPNINLSIPATAQTGDTITLSATGGETYAWFIEDADPFEVAGTSVETRFLLPGTKKVKVVIKVGVCEYTFNGTVVVTGLPVSVEDAFGAEVALYPNPNDGRFEVTLSAAAPTVVEIFDALGRNVYRKTTDQPRLSIDLSEEAGGVYTLRLTRNGQLMSKKVIVR